MKKKYAKNQNIIKDANNIGLKTNLSLNLQNMFSEKWLHMPSNYYKSEEIKKTVA